MVTPCMGAPDEPGRIGTSRDETGAGGMSRYVAEALHPAWARVPHPIACAPQSRSTRCGRASRQYGVTRDGVSLVSTKALARVSSSELSTPPGQGQLLDASPGRVRHPYRAPWSVFDALPRGRVTEDVATPQSACMRQRIDLRDSPATISPVTVGRSTRLGARTAPGTALRPSVRERR